MSILQVVISIIPVLAVILWIVWRRRKTQHGLPQHIRKAGVFASQLLMRLETLMNRYHNVVLAVYVVIFLSLITGYSTLQQLGGIAKIAAYCFYALAMFNLFALFIARWLLDPVPKELTDDPLVALDPTKVTLVPPDTRERFQQLVNLGEEAFAAWGGSKDDRHVAYTKFLQSNPEAFKLIMRNDVTEPIGFSCVIPLRENAFRQFRLGILDSWDFSPNDILPTSNYLCLNAIYLQRTSQNEHTRAVSILCNHIAIFVRRNRRRKLPVLVADGLTLEGRRFLKRYGFESCYRTKDQTPIYELDLSRPGILSDRANAFFSCLKNALNAQAAAI